MSGYNPNRHGKGSPEGGRFAPGDASRQSAGQVDLGFDQTVDEQSPTTTEFYDPDYREGSEKDPDTSGVVGNVAKMSRSFDTPHGPVTIDVHRGVTASFDEGGMEVGREMHQNLAYEQYGEEHGSETVDGVNYHDYEAVVTTEADGTVSIDYASSYGSVEHPGDIDTDVDWDDYFDPNDHQFNKYVTEDERSVNDYSVGKEYRVESLTNGDSSNEIAFYVESRKVGSDRVLTADEHDDLVAAGADLEYRSMREDAYTTPDGEEHHSMDGYHMSTWGSQANAEAEAQEYAERVGLEDFNDPARRERLELSDGDSAPPF